MKNSRYSGEQIIGILKEAEVGVSVKEIIGNFIMIG